MDYSSLNIMLVRLFKSFWNLFILEFKTNIFFKKNWGPIGTAGTRMGENISPDRYRGRGVARGQGQGVGKYSPRHLAPLTSLVGTTLRTLPLWPFWKDAIVPNDESTVAKLGHAIFFFGILGLEWCFIFVQFEMLDELGHLDHVFLKKEMGGL